MPESDFEHDLGSSTNTKASKLVSDGMLTLNEQGHYEPNHKHPETFQESSPYQPTRAHSVQSVGSGANCSIEYLANVSSASGSMPQAQDQSMSDSKTASPLLTAASLVPESSAKLSLLGLSGITSDSFMPENYNFSCIDDHQHPVFSAGLSQPADVDGTYIGLEFADKDPSTFALSTYSQPQSFSGFGPPPISISGEVSEVRGFIQDGFGLGNLSHTDMLGRVFSSGRDYEGLLDAKELGRTEFDVFSKLAEDRSKYTASAPSSQMHSIHPAEKSSQRQRSGELKCQSHRSLPCSGVGCRLRDRARSKPLPPIVAEDLNNIVALKRARNTATARKYRQRQVAKFEELEAKVKDLEADREHWIAVAKEHGAVV
ncbi:hypothetical protein F5883DRAFT_577954 [Diaporthe sp. PMI_573]|nr:hypothetical protein F5883DRAFT_577954 [Diaporthaceae sp. PMI_573]